MTLAGDSAQDNGHDRGLLAFKRMQRRGLPLFGNACPSLRTVSYDGSS